MRTKYKMRKIESKDVNVGELVYLVGIKHKKIKCILKILNVLPDSLKFKILYLAMGEKKQKLTELKLTDILLNGIICKMKILTMKTFIFYRLNKKEVSEFDKLRIIKNL